MDAHLTIIVTGWHPSKNVELVFRYHRSDGRIWPLVLE